MHCCPRPKCDHLYCRSKRKKKGGKFTLNYLVPLQWCWNTGITSMVQETRVYKKQEHDAGQIASAISTHFFPLKNKILRKDTGRNSDGPFSDVCRHIQTYQKWTLYLHSPATFSPQHVRQRVCTGNTAHWSLIAICKNPNKAGSHTMQKANASFWTNSAWRDEERSQAGSACSPLWYCIKQREPREIAPWHELIARDICWQRSYSLCVKSPLWGRQGCGGSGGMGVGDARNEDEEWALEQAGVCVCVRVCTRP